MICGQIYGFSFTSVSLYLMIFAHIKTKKRQTETNTDASFRAIHAIQEIYYSPDF